MIEIKTRREERQRKEETDEKRGWSLETLCITLVMVLVFKTGKLKLPFLNHRLWCWMLRRSCHVMKCISLFGARAFKGDSVLPLI